MEGQLRGTILALVFFFFYLVVNFSLKATIQFENEARLRLENNVMMHWSPRRLISRQFRRMEEEACINPPKLWHAHRPKTYFRRSIRYAHGLQHSLTLHLSTLVLMRIARASVGSSVVILSGVWCWRAQRRLLPELVQSERGAMLSPVGPDQGRITFSLQTKRTEPYHTWFGSEPRSPPLQGGLGSLVLLLHPSAIAVFTPAQTNHTKRENAPGFDSTQLNKAGVNTPWLCLPAVCCWAGSVQWVYHDGNSTEPNSKVAAVKPKLWADSC